MSAGDRLPCCVPFCRRTIAAGRFREWLCPKHWRLVSPTRKARKRRTERLLAKARARADRARIELRWCHHASTAWERCKAEAIERAMGIAA